jgi:peroxiredoxin
VNVLRIMSVTAVFCAAAVLSVFADDAPINSSCPLMKGKPLRPGVVSVYQGKTIGFCCNKCKKQFDSDPAKWIAKVSEFQADPAGTAAEVGKKAPVFVAKDTDGKNVGLADFKGKIVVLQWIDPKCTACTRLATGGLVTKLIKDLKAAKDDLVFLEVCSTDGVDGKALAKFLTDNKIDAKGLVDADGRVGKAFGATMDSQCFVIDGDGVLRYAGAVDDDADGKKADKAVNYVLAAVKAIVGGTKIETETSKPYGTEIKYKK